MTTRFIKWLRLALSAHRLNADLAAENMALRQQLGMYKRREKKPRFNQWDRLFWIILYRLWPGWSNALENAKPATVIKWHKAGFRQFWRWKSSRRRPGRPRISPEIRALIKIMANDNPIWGAPRIHDELAKLGFEVDERTISRYLERLHRKPQKPSFRSWIIFLRSHMSTMVSIDMFSVRTVFFRVLTVFIVLSHDRRRVLHFHVTDHLCERIVGSIRRDSLDHMIILSERHLLAILKNYFDYYHDDRTHQSLDGDTPAGRPVEPRPSPDAKVVGQPRLGGLHHRYAWQKAA